MVDDQGRGDLCFRGDRPHRGARDTVALNDAQCRLDQLKAPRTSPLQASIVHRAGGRWIIDFGQRGVQFGDRRRGPKDSTATGREVARASARLPNYLAASGGAAGGVHHSRRDSRLNCTEGRDWTPSHGGGGAPDSGASRFPP